MWWNGRGIIQWRIRPPNKTLMPVSTDVTNCFLHWLRRDPAPSIGTVLSSITVTVTPYCCYHLSTVTGFVWKVLHPLLIHQTWRLWIISCFVYWTNLSVGKCLMYFWFESCHPAIFDYKSYEFYGREVYILQERWQEVVENNVGYVHTYVTFI